MRHNSTQVAACRPHENRPELAIRDGFQHSSRPNHRTKAVPQQYNPATEWEWIESKDSNTERFQKSYWTVDNIDPLLPDTQHLELAEVTDHIPGCMPLGDLYFFENTYQGENWTVDYCRSPIADLAKLPNTLLAKTIVVLFGEENLEVDKNGRIRLRGLDWLEVHGALWPGTWRASFAERIRQSEQAAEPLKVG